MPNLFETNPAVPREVTLGTSGFAALPEMTVLDVMRTAVAQFGSKKALVAKRDGKQVSWTFQKYQDDVLRVARALIQLGIDAHSCAGILAFNCPEWNIIELGCMFAAVIPFGIYTTNGEEACQFVLNHAKASIVFVEDAEALKKILAIRAQLPALKAIVQLFGTVEAGHSGIYTFEEFLAKGSAAPASAVEERAKLITPGHCCIVIYTSGTTGEPKAVMISHDSLTWVSRIAQSTYGIRAGTEVFVSFLPLSHVAAQIIDVCLALLSGVETFFAPREALRGQLIETLQEVRPTMFMGVPRVWEKVSEKMREVGEQQTGLKKWIAGWARRTGLAGNMALQDGKSLPAGWWLADKLVFSKVKSALGLDRCRKTFTGAAPISLETITYFLSLDIPLYDIYGMSETTAIITLPEPSTFRSGTCGKLLQGLDVLIDRPDREGNGEILVRGRNLMMGFMNNPDATAAEFTREGFFKTGDIGRFDGEQNLLLTGRIKEIIITANGENVPPLMVEGALKHQIPIISNAMVIGDNRKFLTCLMTLKCELGDDGLPSDRLPSSTLKLFEQLGISGCTTVSAALKNSHVHSFIAEGVQVANRKIANNAQHVQKWRLLPVDFSVYGNELGPTLKLKRRVVMKKYKNVVDEMYEGEGAA
ncbi:long-chain-fatty-acid-CoA ligase ACSBG2 [Capsaspora owczarzaki ATCC 30864]|uniref:Long-chain-fatty-acid-CoA ligase ACSBG2 n=1 Tax=Capsaspora owczarzaki (strain ATCC 30864) TaxID=595528 RepID=A0A0D2WNN9_CAPO3|nr:long-chain-fatty-acid-CoA ligase ACSBG2 [Capsaspora owczarzaki ATCC 30864]KJE92043.1 long-chain-fatty-acid-CoA ligase ACSBG2 [Capsaspora owczarzaki ATCC 30864]|eukprot:XP_004363914.1 long-chain-fatty-acid-CoA ligase ACSBG2 [Capsaspora owczarzaki ATCC 30864]